jgi:hypothetical protein
MSPRVRVALVAIAGLVLASCALVGLVMPNDAGRSGSSFGEANESSAALLAVRVKSPLPTVPRGLPQATLVAAILTALRLSGRGRSLRGLPFRLGDVGDRWRALLFGAPPSLL